MAATTRKPRGAATKAPTTCKRRSGRPEGRSARGDVVRRKAAATRAQKKVADQIRGDATNET
jgi:hypothetical protein